MPCVRAPVCPRWSRCLPAVRLLYMLRECEPGKQPRGAPLTIKGVISSGGTERAANQRAVTAATAAATSRSTDGGNPSSGATKTRKQSLEARVCALLQSHKHQTSPESSSTGFISQPSSRRRHSRVVTTPGCQLRVFVSLLRTRNSLHP